MRKCKLREVDGQQRALGIPAELFAGKLIAAVGAVNFVIQNVHFMMRKTKGQYLPIWTKLNFAKAMLWPVVNLY